VFILKLNFQNNWFVEIAGLFSASRRSFYWTKA